MIAMAVSPWGKMPIDSSRGVPARTVAPLQSLRVGGANFSFPAAPPSGRGRAGPSLACPADPIPARDLGLTKDAGGAPEADSHRASGAAAFFASRAEGAPAGRAIRPDGHLPLRPVADHCVGGAEAARRSHKPEVAGSNPAPATIMLELSDAVAGLLALVAAHEGKAPERLAALMVSAAVVALADRIGVPGLLDGRGEPRPPP